MDMSWYVYTPTSWQRDFGYKAHEDYCRFSVHDSGRSVGFHQCNRKPKITIEGFGFCTQHAKMIQDDMKRQAKAKAKGR